MNWTSLIRKSLMASAGAAALMIAAPMGAANAGEKWDMPAGYSAKNFITQRYIAFGEEVTKNSGGELEVVVHPGGSLYK
ncbi:MAG: C4-dicarboxylate ABC transporter substrate-binding protein, partial [bacterium]|nr:C4-dicarboxylate ABC transporter substrate-binding protein [bacterium]